MIEGYTPKKMGLHLFFGLIYHEGLESYDRLKAEGIDHETAIRRVVRLVLGRTWVEDKPWDSEDQYKSRATLLRSVVWYLEQYQNDPAKTFILANGKPAVELSFKMELDEGVGDKPYVLSGHIDRVVDFAGETYVMDHKTTKSALSRTYYNSYEPDNQMSLYTLATQVVFNAQVRGVIIDAAQIGVNFTRFDRGITLRTEQQLEEWLVDAKRWFKLAEYFAKENYWPTNDKACKFCDFRNVCSKDPGVRHMFLTDFEKRQWNPLKPRTSNA
jgi:hypothetical protein